MVDRWLRSSRSKSPSTVQNLSASLVSGARCCGTSNAAATGVVCYLATEFLSPPGHARQDLTRRGTPARAWGACDDTPAQVWSDGQADQLSRRGDQPHGSAWLVELGRRVRNVVVARRTRGVRRAVPNGSAPFDRMAANPQMTHVRCLRFRALARHPADRDLTWPPPVPVGAMGRVTPPCGTLCHPASIECAFESAQQMLGNS